MYIYGLLVGVWTAPVLLLVVVNVNEVCAAVAVNSSLFYLTVETDGIFKVVPDKVAAPVPVVVKLRGAW